MIEDPQILMTAAQSTAYIHLSIPRSQVRQVMGPGIRELMTTLAAQGITPAGPWFTHHQRMDPSLFDFRISVPVPRPVAATGRVQPGELSARRVARTNYHGPYEGLAGAWGEFEKWIKANGYATAQDLWEVYAVGPESGPDPAKWRTELNQPLEGR